MTEARPGGPAPTTLRAMERAAETPGHFVPFLSGRFRSAQSYYQRKYPGFTFRWIDGTLHIRKDEEAE